MSKKLLAEKVIIAWLLFYLEQSFEFTRNYCNLITKIMPLLVWKSGLYSFNSLADSSRLLYLEVFSRSMKLSNTFDNCLHCMWLFEFFRFRDRVSRPTSVFDRNGFDPFARSRRNSLSKKSKMKQMKQQVTPSIVKQTDCSQVGL